MQLHKEATVPTFVPTPLKRVRSQNDIAEIGDKQICQIRSMSLPLRSVQLNPTPKDNQSEPSHIQDATIYMALQKVQSRQGKQTPHTVDQSEMKLKRY